MNFKLSRTFVLDLYEASLVLVRFSNFMRMEYPNLEAGSTLEECETTDSKKFTLNLYVTCTSERIKDAVKSYLNGLNETGFDYAARGVTEVVYELATPDNVNKFLPDGMELSVRHYHDGNDPDHRIRCRKQIKFVTIAVILDQETRMVAGTGVAVCSPKDQPKRRVGWGVAVNRAINDMRQAMPL